MRKKQTIQNQSHHYERLDQRVFVRQQRLQKSYASIEKPSYHVFNKRVHTRDVRQHLLQKNEYSTLVRNQRIKRYAHLTQINVPQNHSFHRHLTKRIAQQVTVDKPSNHTYVRQQTVHRQSWSLEQHAQFTSKKWRKPRTANLILAPSSILHCHHRSWQVFPGSSSLCRRR